ncbi:aminotransferase class V-fold PLP-dependent enzyme [uncultured Thermus sp.]|uniref:pyridoxal-phosphate-dependent aminotransferase family protein n=1 Tax=uncultured Thermus sp. TaxID=157149 RepID=UPI002616467F|nr:aminotransferase class V-fold PLP-dependent enzyme [uncultured Thermus sp.]
MEWLLTPGPVRLHPKALEALARPQLHHRTEPAREVFLKARDLLKKAFQTQGEVLVLTGSGTLAMEALVHNLFSPGERVLVPVYGKFSERFAEIAESAGLAVDRWELPYGEVPSPEGVARPGYRGLLLVHSETSTGALVDLPALAKAFKEANPEGLVGADMVTSLLVREVALEAWGVDAAASGSQKGLMCPPGLGFVALSPTALEALRPRGYYYDLSRELKAQGEGESAWTPAINLVGAVAAVLEEVVPRLPEHLALKAWQNGLLYQVGEELGLRPVPKVASPAVAAFYLPEGIPYRAVKEAFAQRGAVIAGGQGPLKGKIFRLSLMGHYQRYEAFGVAALFKEAFADILPTS